MKKHMDINKFTLNSLFSINKFGTRPEVQSTQWTHHSQMPVLKMEKNQWNINKLWILSTDNS